MAPESTKFNDRKFGRFSPRLPVIVFVLVALLFWVKSQARSVDHSVQATDDDSDLHPEPEHPIPFAHWDVFDGDDEFGEYLWGKDDYKPNDGGGDYSAWCAKDGSNGVDPSNISMYPSYINSWMVYGPFSLENYTEAFLEFSYWNQSEEVPDSEYDYFTWMASIDNNLFFGNRVKGDSNGWQPVQFNLSDVPDLDDLTGLSQIWIAFQFLSDRGNHYEPLNPLGAFVDDIVLKARSSPTGPWDYLMTEDFEGEFPPVLELESMHLPVVIKSGS